MWVLAKSLHSLFQSFLATTNFETSWKEGKICPINEGGGRGEARSYRFINVTSYFKQNHGGTCQKKTNLLPGENDLLADTWHGFWPGRSCLTHSYNTMNGCWNSCSTNQMWMWFISTLQRFSIRSVMKGMSRTAFSRIVEDGYLSER